MLILYSASGTVKKVIEINPYLLGTMAGGAGESSCSLHVASGSFIHMGS
jgi:20S proteasome alpha/beta subunit